MSLDLGIPGTDLFLGKGDREGGVGLSRFASEGGYGWAGWKEWLFYTRPPFALLANKL